MEFNEIKKAYIELTAFAKESLRKSLQENKADTAKYLSGYLDGLYMMYREVEVQGSEEALESKYQKSLMLVKSWAMKVLADTYVRYVITGFYVPTIRPLHAIHFVLLADRKLTGRGKCDVSIACCGNGVYAIYKKEELNIDKSWTLLRGGSVFF